MNKYQSKFPRFFACMFAALMLAMFISCFFSLLSVANIYFCMLLVVIVFIVLDKKYGFFIANYKIIFTMFDLSNLMAVVAVLIYEYMSHSVTLNIFLFIMMGIMIVMLLIDILFLKNHLLAKKECLLIDFIQICLMICMLTYFYGVSSYWYSVVAVIFEIIAAMLKCYYVGKFKNLEPKEENPPEKDIEKTIRKLESKTDEHGEDIE